MAWEPVRRLVPLRGDKDLRFRWTLAPGAAASDPVVDVVRRVIVLEDLGYGSPSWTDARRIRKAAEVLTLGDVVSTEEISQWTHRSKRAATGTERVLVDAPQVNGTRATVFVCTNLRDVPAIHSMPHGGGTTRIEVTLTQGVWRVSSYDNNAATSRPFFERCSTFGDPPNPMLAGG